MGKLRKTIAAILSIGFMALSFNVSASADWVQNNGKTYYEDDAGNKLTGWQTIDGAKYYFNSKGVMRTGWITMKSGNQYYFSKKTGKMTTGFVKISGKQYYFNNNGVLQKGYVKISNKIYYFDEDSGYLIEQIKDKLVMIDNKIYYCKSNGKLAKGMTDVTVGGKTFTLYFGSDYSSQTITTVIDGTTYIFEANRGLVDSYTNIEYGGYNDDVIKLTDFAVYVKNGKLYWNGYLENTSSKYDYWVCVHADFYDKNGNVLKSEYIMVLCDKLKGGQKYKIDDYCLIKDIKDIARIEFTTILKHKK